MAVPADINRHVPWLFELRISWNNEGQDTISRNLRGIRCRGIRPGAILGNMVLTDGLGTTFNQPIRAPFRGGPWGSGQGVRLVIELTTIQEVELLQNGQFVNTLRRYNNGIEITAGPVLSYIIRCLPWRRGGIPIPNPLGNFCFPYRTTDPYLRVGRGTSQHGKETCVKTISGRLVDDILTSNPTLRPNNGTIWDNGYTRQCVVQYYNSSSKEINIHTDNNLLSLKINLIYNWLSIDDSDLINDQTAIIPWLKINKIICRAYNSGKDAINNCVSPQGFHFPFNGGDGGNLCFSTDFRNHTGEDILVPHSLFTGENDQGRLALFIMLYCGWPLANLGFWLEVEDQLIDRGGVTRIIYAYWNGSTFALPGLNDINVIIPRRAAGVIKNMDHVRDLCFVTPSYGPRVTPNSGSREEIIPNFDSGIGGQKVCLSDYVNSWLPSIGVLDLTAVYESLKINGLLGPECFQDFDNLWKLLIRGSYGVMAQVGRISFPTLACRENFITRKISGRQIRCDGRSPSNLLNMSQTPGICDFSVRVPDYMSNNLIILGLYERKSLNKPLDLLGLKYSINADLRISFRLYSCILSRLNYQLSITSDNMQVGMNKTGYNSVFYFQYYTIYMEYYDDFTCKQIESVANVSVVGLKYTEGLFLPVHHSMDCGISFGRLVLSFYPDLYMQDLLGMGNLDVDYTGETRLIVSDGNLEQGFPNRPGIMNDQPLPSSILEFNVTDEFLQNSRKQFYSLNWQFTGENNILVSLAPANHLSTVWAWQRVGLVQLHRREIMNTRIVPRLDFACERAILMVSGGLNQLLDKLFYCGLTTRAICGWSGKIKTRMVATSIKSRRNIDKKNKTLKGLKNKSEKHGEYILFCNKFLKENPLCNFRGCKCRTIASKFEKLADGVQEYVASGYQSILEAGGACELGLALSSWHGRQLGYSFHFLVLCYGNIDRWSTGEPLPVELKRFFTENTSLIPYYWQELRSMKQISKYLRTVFSGEKKKPKTWKLGDWLSSEEAFLEQAPPRVNSDLSIRNIRFSDVTYIFEEDTELKTDGIGSSLGI